MKASGAPGVPRVGPFPPARIGAPSRSELIVDGLKVAVWNHSHESVFGTVTTRRVCQAWFGTKIGPAGLYGEARRSLDHRVKSLLEKAGHTFVIDRKPGRSRQRVLPSRHPRYFVLTASDPDHVEYWLTGERIEALRRTKATVLTQFDLRVLAPPRARIHGELLGNLVATARMLI